MPSTYSPSAEDLLLESSGEFTSSGSFLTTSQRARRSARRNKRSRAAENTLNGVKVKRDGLAFDYLVCEEARHRLTTPIQEVGPRGQSSDNGWTDPAEMMAVMQKFVAEFRDGKEQLRNQERGIRELGEELRQEKADFVKERSEFKRAQEAFQHKEKESQIRMQKLEDDLKSQRSALKEERKKFLQEKVTVEESHRKEWAEIESERCCLQALEKELDSNRRRLEQDREEVRRNAEAIESLESAKGESLLDLATLRRQLREVQVSMREAEQKIASGEELRSLLLQQRKKEEELAKKNTLSYRFWNFSLLQTAEHVTVGKELQKVKARLECVLRSTG